MNKIELFDQDNLITLQQAIHTNCDVAEKSIKEAKEILANLELDLSYVQLAKERKTFYEQIISEIESYGYTAFCLPVDSILTDITQSCYESLFVVNIGSWPYFIGIDFIKEPHILVNQFNNQQNVFQYLDIYKSFVDFMKQFIGKWKRVNY